MRACKALLSALLLLALSGLYASADEVILKSGGRVQGEVTSSDDSHVVLQTAYGSVSFETADIFEVKYSSALEKEIRDQLNTLAPSDTSTRLKLASKAQSAGLDEMSKSIYTAVIAINPEERSARQALGYVYYEGEWVTAKDKSAHPRLVPYHGRWLAPRERDDLRRTEANGEYFTAFGVTPTTGSAMLQAISDIDVAIEPRGGYIVRRHVKSLPVKDRPYVFSVDALSWQRLGIFIGVTFIDSTRKRIEGFGELKYTIFATELDTLGNRKIGKELVSQTVAVKPEMWLKKSDFKYWDTRISGTYEKVASDAAKKAWADEYYMNYDGILYILANRGIDSLTPPGVYYVEATFKVLDREKKIGRFVQYAELR